jgi:hypothetical protein
MPTEAVTTFVPYSGSHWLRLRTRLLLAVIISFAIGVGTTALDFGLIKPIPRAPDSFEFLVRSSLYLSIVLLALYRVVFRILARDVASDARPRFP